MIYFQILSKNLKLINLYIVLIIIGLTSCKQDPTKQLNKSIPESKVEKLKQEQSNIIDLDKVYEFLNEMSKDKSSGFNLSESVNFRIFVMDKNSFLKDSLFSKADIEFFEKQIKWAKNYKWQKGKIKGARLIPREKISKIFKGKNGWDNFRSAYGDCLTEYSFPLFTKNYEYCVFAQWTQCDYLAGGGSLSLYKFEDGKWVYIMDYASGIS